MFKRSIVALTVLATVFCPVTNAKPVQSSEQTIERGAVEVEYMSREVGNGNGRGGDSFHDGAWNIIKPTPQPIEPVQEPEPVQPVEPVQEPEPAQSIEPVQFPQPTMPSETYNASDEWLIYWYICGTDLETDDSQATGDIKEAIQVQLPPNVKILIQTGNTSQWHHPVINSNGRYLYDSNGLRKISAFESSMYESDTLKEFLKYGEKNYRADHRILIFWDHGGVGGVCQDKENTGQIMSLNALSSAVKSVYGESPARPPFELIGFDTCLMGSYECANNINGFARYMVASEESENGLGWYYTDWLTELAQNPASNGAVLGEKICSGSLADCKHHNDWTASTFSVVDMSAFPRLKQAHEEYFTSALNRANTSRRFISDFDYIVHGEGSLTEGYKGCYVDLKSLATNTQYLLPDASRNLLSAIDAVIVGQPSNGAERIGGGISTYYPYNGYCHSAYLEQYSASDKQKAFYRLVSGATPSVTAGVTEQSGKSAQRSSRFNVAALQGHAVTIENNQAVVHLTPEEMESVSRVSCLIGRNVENPNPELGIKEEGGIFLGSNLAVKSDRQTGTFRSNLKATWPALDGHLISLDRTFAGNGYELYDVPILLNGEPRLLQVSYNQSTQEYTIERASKEASKDGMASRDVDYLKAGDEITPLFLGVAGGGSDDDDEDVIARFSAPDGEVILSELLAA